MVRNPAKIDKALLNAYRNSNLSETNVFWSACRLQMLREAEKKKLEYKWTGRISPSNLEFSMCPHDYIREEVHKYSSSNSEGNERMELGKAFHVLFTKFISTHPNLLYENPFKEGLPSELTLDTRKDWKSEFKNRFPALPVLDMEYMISGEADAVISIDGEPVPVDMKFPQTKAEAAQSFNRGKFPSEKYITQVAVYVYVMNKMKYYPVQIKRFGVVAYNPFVEKMEEGEMEAYYYWSDYQEKTELLLEHIQKERLAFINDSPSECSYPNCKRHST